MNLNQRLEPLPAFETNYSSRGDALLLAAVLAVGLTLVTPALSIFTGIPTLVFVGIVGVGYAALIFLFRQLIVGFSVGLIITVMFKANISPLPTSYTGHLIGHIEPGLWLFYAPLAGILIYLGVTIPLRNWVTFSRAELVFAAFVVWTIISALTGVVARFDVAVLFSLLMFQVLIVFAVSRYVVQSGILSFRTLVEVFALGVCAHATFGLVELANGETFGLSHLGEPSKTEIVATISLGPFSTIPIGTHVAGFTGQSFSLAALIVLIAPALVVLALRASGWRRWTLAVVTGVLTVILRMTGTDAGKGGFILAMITFACAAVVLYRRGMAGFSLPNSIRAFGRTVLPAVLVAFAAVFALFTPSSNSGAGSAVTNIDTSNEPATKNSGSSGGSSGGSGAISGGGSDPTTGPNTTAGNSGGTGASSGSVGAHHGPSTIESILRNLSIPGFDISTLGGRLQQYAVGLDLFLANPIFGIGALNFFYISTNYGFSTPIPLHSIYIVLLAGTGLPGFVLYSVTLVMVLWAGWRATTTADGSDSLLLVAVMSGLIGILGFMFWGHALLTHLPVMMSFWVLAGAVVGTARRDTCADV